jgi:hypothetical protein
MVLGPGISKPAASSIEDVSGGQLWLCPGSRPSLAWHGGCPSLWVKSEGASGREGVMRYQRSCFAMLAAGLMLLGQATSVEAQGRGKDRGLRIPPGHMPGPGMCRVWYPGVPPGHQPPAMPCGALRGYRFAGAVVVESPRRGGAFGYWDEVWAPSGFHVQFVFDQRDGWWLEARDRGPRERYVERDRPRRGRGRKH